jgi:hypothetical protein
MELRKEVRYRLDAPALFSWQAGRRGCFQGEGITRDISVQGAFIVTATMPPLDCPIHVDVLLPSVSGMKVAVRISGKARVIRVQHPRTNEWVHGFAVATDDLNQWGLTVMHSEFENAALGASGAS